MHATWQPSWPHNRRSRSVLVEGYDAEGTALDASDHPPSRAVAPDRGARVGFEVLHPLRVGSKGADGDAAANAKCHHGHSSCEARTPPRGFQNDESKTERERRTDSGAHCGQHNSVQPSKAEWENFAETRHLRNNPNVTGDVPISHERASSHVCQRGSSWSLRVNHLTRAGGAQPFLGSELNGAFVSMPGSFGSPSARSPMMLRWI
jgi:hypothetical protein